MRLTREELTGKLLARVAREPREFSTKTIHLVERAMPARTMLHIGSDQEEVTSESFLVIIDEAPGAYWTHPVRYELHDVETGAIRVIQSKYPLENPEFTDEIVAVHIPDLPQLKKPKDAHFFELPPLRVEDVLERTGTASYDLPSSQAAHRYALFVTGMDNMPDFHNDFVRMRDLLIDRYGYDPAHITIAMGAPSVWSDLLVDYAGTIAGLDAALDSYAPGGTRVLSADDHLFLYTFDHGGSDAGQAYLCMAPTWNQHYPSSRMKQKLDNIHCGELIVAMNQCYSGGFVTDVLTSTGPGSIAILTACSDSQNAYPSGASSAGGYFSGVLVASLNWGFPASIPADFPGFTAGELTWHDSNGDGMICAEDAWNFVQTEMYAHHSTTISGIETPQYGVSAAGVGTNLFWGKPDLRVMDSAAPYWWESPDIFLVDPATTPTDLNTVPGNPTFWGDNYHPDTPNRLVARVHNFGCAPARNVAVELRVMSFGAGGGTSVVGSPTVTNVNPGHHDYAWVDWNFPSALIHRCAMARATCPGDPAAPFGTDMLLDDNQAQRNMDPAYCAPQSQQQKPMVIEKVFLLHNRLRQSAVFTVKPVGRLEGRLAKATMEGLEPDSKITLKAGEKRKIKVAFQIREGAELGEKFRFPVEIKRMNPEPMALGGVTIHVEVAIGRLEGTVVAKDRRVFAEGSVKLANIKQPELAYEAKLDRRGRFSLKDIVPGPYTMVANCPEGFGQASVFVEPNRITRSIIRLEAQHIWIGKVLAETRAVKVAVAR
ncbi:carboxypeptidase-like regulatory domain-containing protein [Paludibaculum fermentans]|uniref:carboxypeptidase-like regulatory domain-containing protein n=1 Tax=Paludibaculum fermentans TaxID=1473598 RepID=UPI003EB9EC83